MSGPVSAPPDDPAPARGVGSRTRNALLLGNFAVGCGVMVVPGSLNDISHDLGISVALAGQLITAGAFCLCLGAPLLAAVVAHVDRRRLLTLCLLAYAAGHLACACTPGFGLLLPLRALGVLAAAVYTPQAAAAMGVMSSPADRGRNITHVFLGWSLASVLGMPISAWVAEAAGWRWAFVLVAGLAVLAAGGVWRQMPDGVRPPALSLASWRRVATEPVLLAIVAVTALGSAGQFTQFSYQAPYFHSVLGANAGEISGLFLWFGLFGLAGNLWLSRRVDQIGAARAVGWLLAAMGLGLGTFGLPTGVLGMALVLVPWALGCFAYNSAQQARLGQAAPLLAPALMALNTSAIYLGQAVGAATGGMVMAVAGFAPLHWLGLAWLVAAAWLSAWAKRRLERQPLVF